MSDDVALPLGAFRLKAGGSNGGHNGLGHIQQLIGQNYARLRMGIGNEYQQGHQIDWVLGQFSDDELQLLQPRIETATDVIRSFVLAGIDVTMNQYNKVGKTVPQLPGKETIRQPTLTRGPAKGLSRQHAPTSGSGLRVSSRPAL